MPDKDYTIGICPFAVNILDEYRCTSTRKCGYAEDAGNGGSEKICNNPDLGFVASGSVREQELRVAEEFRGILLKKNRKKRNEF